jgi:hypothetical protein
MSPQLRMLLWKEWRDRRAQFLVCLLSVVLVARVSVDAYYAVALWFGLSMSIFVAMRTSLGETTDRTGSFTSALPISPQRQGWIRLAGGLAVLMAPIVLGAVLISLCLALGWMKQLPSNPPGGRLSVPMSELKSLSAPSAVALQWRVTAVVVSSVTSLYVVLSLLGGALRTETHAGFAGAAVAILWFLGIFLVQTLHDSGPPEVVTWVNAISPWGMLASFGLGSERGLYGELCVSIKMLGPLLVQAVLQLALAVWFVRRYSRRLPGGSAATARKAVPRVQGLWSFTLPNRPIALMWLTLRQSVPMCLPGLLIACLTAHFQAVGVFDGPHAPLRNFAGSLPTSMEFIGLVWAVVVGAGIFSAEINWRIGEFWRTRPIPFWQFFAAKFFVGLAAVLLVLDATTVAVACFSLNSEPSYGADWPYIACVVPMHSVMFALAVAWVCVLRRPVLGAMAAFASFVSIEFIIDWSHFTRGFEPLSVYIALVQDLQVTRGDIGLTSHGYPFVAAGMAVMFFAAILVGGLALRRYDRGRQSG